MEAEPKDTRVDAVRELRRVRQRRAALRLGMFVVLPTLLAAAYFAFIATPQFESVSTFTVRSAEGAAPVGLELFIASVPGGSAARDALLVQDYIRSRDLFAELDTSLGLSAHYARGDFFGRLAEDAMFEERFEHYLTRISVAQDSQSGTVTLRVRAYDAETAARTAAAIVAAAEGMVNRLNERARTDRVEQARANLAESEARLTAARGAIVEFQREHDDINPLQTAAALLEVRTGLEGELAAAQADLSVMRRTLQPGAPDLVAQSRRVAGLRAQIRDQTRRLSNDDGSLSSAIAAFEPLLLEKEFAQRAHQSAVASLALARVESARQQRYIVMISAVSEPDEATHPNGGRGTLTVLAFSMAILLIGSLLVASIREHANL